MDSVAWPPRVRVAEGFLTCPSRTRPLPDPRVRMTGMDGWSFKTPSGASHWKVPISYIRRTRKPELDERGSSGGRGILEKPFNSAAMLDAFDDAAGRPARPRALQNELTGVRIGRVDGSVAAAQDATRFEASVPEAGAPTRFHRHVGTTSRRSGTTPRSSSTSVGCASRTFA